jgi:hypothetical protein
MSVTHVLWDWLSNPPEGEAGDSPYLLNAQFERAAALGLETLPALIEREVVAELTRGPLRGLQLALILGALQAVAWGELAEAYRYQIDGVTARDRAQV